MPMRFWNFLGSIVIASWHKSNRISRDKSIFINEAFPLGESRMNWIGLDSGSKAEPPFESKRVSEICKLEIFVIFQSPPIVRRSTVSRRVVGAFFSIALPKYIDIHSNVRSILHYISFSRLFFSSFFDFVVLKKNAGKLTYRISLFCDTITTYNWPEKILCASFQSLV